MPWLTTYHLQQWKSWKCTLPLEWAQPWVGKTYQALQTSSKVSQKRHISPARFELSCQDFIEAFEIFQQWSLSNRNQTDKILFTCPVCPGFHHSIFSAHEQQHLCLSLYTFCQEPDFINLQNLFLYPLKANHRAWLGGNSDISFLKCTYSAISKWPPREWLIPCGGWRHKSAPFCLMQALARGMLQLYCWGNPVTLSRPHLI